MNKGTWGDQTVAIKSMLLPGDPSSDARVAKEKKKFEEEAKLVYTLSHANIVKVYHPVLMSSDKRSLSLSALIF